MFHLQGTVTIKIKLDTFFKGKELGYSHNLNQVKSNYKCINNSIFNNLGSTLNLMGSRKGLDLLFQVCLCSTQLVL